MAGGFKNVILNRTRLPIRGVFAVVAWLMWKTLLKCERRKKKALEHGVNFSCEKSSNHFVVYHKS